MALECQRLAQAPCEFYLSSDGSLSLMGAVPTVSREVVDAVCSEQGDLTNLFEGIASLAATARDCQDRWVGVVSGGWGACDLARPPKAWPDGGLNGRSKEWAQPTL